MDMLDGVQSNYFSNFLRRHKTHNLLLHFYFCFAATLGKTPGCRIKWSDSGKLQERSLGLLPKFQARGQRKTRICDEVDEF